MNLTVVFITNRAGCIDLMGSTLAAQQYDPNKFSWELIVVDGYPGRIERGHAEVYLNELKLPLRTYTVPRTKTFPWSRTGFTNAMNSGALLARDSNLIFLHDYTFLPEGSLTRWYEAFTNHPHSLISGIAQEFGAEKPDALEDVLTWRVQPIKTVSLGMWIPETFEVGYWGCPVSFFDDGNGIDERADFCSQYALYSIKAQALAHNYPLLVDHSLVAHMIDHRQWDNGSWTGPQNSPWRMKGIYSDVPQEPQWTGWGANPYHFRTERLKNDEVLSRPVRLAPRFHISLTPDAPKITRDLTEKST